MYIPGAPVYFTKGDKRKAVYHSVLARELLAKGWAQEGVIAPVEEAATQPEAAAEPESEVQPEPAAESEPESDPEPVGLLDMTKNQLIAYAAEQSIAINPYATKAEILTVILECSRG
jgi:hypothetical protein